MVQLVQPKSSRASEVQAACAAQGGLGGFSRKTTHMNTRSCLLTVGVSALLATGSVLTAAPASAAPGSAECLTAQSALGAQLGVASVDIALANQLRAAIATFESLGAQLEPLYVEADLAVADELAALDAADAAVFEASEIFNAAAALQAAKQ